MPAEATTCEVDCLHLRRLQGRDCQVAETGLVVRVVLVDLVGREVLVLLVLLDPVVEDCPSTCRSRSGLVVAVHSRRRRLAMMVLHRRRLLLAIRSLDRLDLDQRQCLEGRWGRSC